MPKKNEHGDVFLRVRIYEKCLYHNHKTIKQHSKQATHHARFPRLPCIYKSTKAIGSLRGYFAVKERSFPVFLLIFPVWCFRVGDSWSCCLVVLPGRAAWSCCLVVLPGRAAWSCCLDVLSGRAAWSCCLVLLPGPAAWSCCRACCPVLLPGPAAWSCCLVRLGPV